MALDAVAMACAEALATGAASRDVVLNILSRTYDDPVTSECDTPLHLPELMAPTIADCLRYDELLTEGAYAAG